MSRRTILVIDYDLLGLGELLQSLETKYRIITARSGKEGINLALKIRPDMILMDVMLMDIDGYKVCNFLSSSPLTGKIPILILSELNHADDELLGLESGAVDFIFKPFHLKAVEMKIRNHFTQRGIWESSVVGSQSFSV